MRATPTERCVKSAPEIRADTPIFVSRMRPDVARPHPPSTHDYAVVTYHTAGRSRFEQRGEWSIGPGDAVLVPAGEPHRILETKSPSVIGIGFCVSCFASDGDGSLLAPFDRVRAGGSAVVRIPEARRAFFEQLVGELERPSPFAVQRSVLTLVLHEIASAQGVDAQGAAGVVADSLAYIERNCLRALTLKEVARAVRRTPAYVTTSLKRATGRSANEWIVAGRMAEARRRLLHSDERIDIVAERVGYADATHFIRMFRRAHGATPASWRKARSE